MTMIVTCLKRTLLFMVTNMNLDAYFRLSLPGCYGVTGCTFVSKTWLEISEMSIFGQGVDPILFRRFLLSMTHSKINI